MVSLHLILNCVLTTGSLKCESPHGEAPTLATPLGTHLVINRDTWKWEGRPLLPYSTLWSLWQAPPALDLYGTSKIHFCFGRAPDPLSALAAAVVPKAPAGSNGHISLVQDLFLSSNHYIGIYSLIRCRWTPHLLHSDKY